MSNIFFGRIALGAVLMIGVASSCSATDDDLGAPAAEAVPPEATSTAPTTSPSTTDPTGSSSIAAPAQPTVTVGAARLAADDFALLRGSRVGVITNRAARVGERSSFDLLAESSEVELVAVFAPEHGFEALAPAGAAVDDEADPSGSVTVYSLYGAERAPSAEALADLDVLLFDLQDVGVRAYTYLSTMGLAMVAAAEADLRFIVLDRPNPLGGEQLGGFVRRPELESFIAQYPIPAVHGLTAGEAALAIRGERWLDGLDDLDLEIVTMDGWRRADRWPQTGLTWLAPSPSLPTVDSVALYPATVLFEATSLSVGRGTPEPFTVLGAPWIDGEAVAQLLNERGLPGVRFEAATIAPVASPSVPEPPWADRSVPAVRIVVDDGDAVLPVALGAHLLEVLWSHAAARGIDDFLERPDVLDLLAGSTELRSGLELGTPAQDIVAAWSSELASFDELRRPYLLYD